jgi:hypothetical protein
MSLAAVDPVRALVTGGTQNISPGVLAGWVTPATTPRSRR